MSKTTEQDNFFAYIAAAVVVTLVAIFVFTWSQTRSSPSNDPRVSFSSFGPYQIETEKLSISATLAVQTSRDDASWPNSNRHTLDAIFKKILAGTDPKVLKTPNGLQKLQDTLTKQCDDELHSKYVQAVLLTDFVAQSRDS